MQLDTAYPIIEATFAIIGLAVLLILLGCILGTCLSYHLTQYIEKSSNRTSHKLPKLKFDAWLEKYYAEKDAWVLFPGSPTAYYDTLSRRKFSNAIVWLPTFGVIAQIKYTLWRIGLKYYNK